jgi:hypothetical protein
MPVILRERFTVVYGIKKIFPTCRLKRLKPRRPKNLWFEVDTEISFALERKIDRTFGNEILRRPVMLCK